MQKPSISVIDYHDRTKHHFQRYAAGPGGLDWATQPDPFRRYAESVQLPLPLLAEDAPAARYGDLYQAGAISPRPCNMQNVAAMLELSFGLSASKQYGANQWALRCNPSSGNLHPTEAYVVTQGCPGIPDGVHHYLSSEHVLEQRCVFAAQTAAHSAGFLLGLSSIHWREAWKYGERAFRYCQHDVGHAIAAARYAAATLGWQVQVQDTWSDAAIAATLGLDRRSDFADAEPEHPDVMLWVQAGAVASAPALNFAAATWHGQANRLSPTHAHDWPVIEEVAEACAKPATSSVIRPATDYPPPLLSPCQARASSIIKQRRSAQQLDGVSSISADVFYRMLDMTLPRADLPPWDAWPWPAAIHLALFVHRVDGLDPGVYFLLRNAHIEQRLRAELSDEFNWVRAEHCPTHLPLYRVQAADARNAAKALSCHQDIAADGAFSLGMLAELDSQVSDAPWRYRQLFWESGLLGQVLYLEAEAAGVQGTGIGCFFDDGVHDVLGIQGHWLQSLYHFTVGGGLTDARLQNQAPYAHLQRASIA